MEHHLSHIASSFFCSPYEEAMCLSVDGFGDFVSTMLAVVGPVAAVRPYLLMKTALLMLAFDLWLLRVPSGGSRMSLDGFNVAHFQWLDSVQPLPTPGLYIGIVLLAGMVAFVWALVDAGLWSQALLALLYAYSWMMSMLDNYQHHYFLSLVLVAFVFFPRVRAFDLYPADQGGVGQQRLNASQRTINSWAYVLLGVNVAILYLFTAINKLEPGWQVKTMLEKLTHNKERVASLEAWITYIGVPPEFFWLLMQAGVVGTEILIAVAYLLAVRQDEQQSLWRRIVIWLGFVAVVVFNGIMNEWLFSIRIGWFSYYMMAFASVYFLPAQLLWQVEKVLIWPGRKLATLGSIFLANLSRAPKLTAGMTALSSLATIFCIGVVGARLDLPGAANAGYLTALVLLGMFLFALLRGRYQGASRYIFATGLATIFLWVTVTQSMVRFDYYHRVGDHWKSREEPQAAIEAYEKALRHVPPWAKKTEDRIVPEDGANEMTQPESLG